MTDFLADTQIVLWAGARPDRLSTAVQRALTDPENQVFVSAISIAEMAIKASIGKLSMPIEPLALCDALQYQIAVLTGRHAARLRALPLLHRDPFDRLLIAQAIEDDLTLITSDRDIARYKTVRVLENE